MKVKIEVKSWNNFSPPPPHTHTSGGGGCLFDLPCTQGQLFMDAKLFNGTSQYQKFLLSPKINLFGLHKIAWCQWQPIGHCSLQADPRLTLACCTYFHRFFLSSTKSRKTSCQLLVKQNGPLIAKKSWLEQFILPQ